MLIDIKARLTHRQHVNRQQHETKTRTRYKAMDVVFGNFGYGAATVYLPLSLSLTHKDTYKHIRVASRGGDLHSIPKMMSGWKKEREKWSVSSCSLVILKNGVNRTQ